MKHLKRLLPYLGGLLLLFLLLRQIDPRSVVHALAEAKPSWLLAGCAWYLLTNVLRAWRFGLLLRMEGIIEPLRLLPEMLALSFLNNVLPSRAGELSFPYFLHQRHHVPVGESMTTLVLARIFDYVAVACLYVIFALWELPNLAPNAAQVVGAAAGLLLMTVVGLALAPWLAGMIWHLVRQMASHGRWAQRPLPGTLLNWGEQAVQTLSRLRRVRVYMLSLAWSLLIWLCTFAWFASLMAALGLPQRYPLVVVGATFASLAKALPLITIGGFGAHEAGWTLGFRLTGMETATAITSGFAVNILTLLMSVLFGGAALLFLTRAGRQGQKTTADSTVQRI